MGLLLPPDLTSPGVEMSEQGCKLADMHDLPSRHGTASGCSQTSLHQGGAMAASTNNGKHERDDVAAPTTVGQDERAGRRRRSSGISETFSARVKSCRKAAKRIVSRDWFDQAVVGLILVNCVFLALDDPTVEASCTQTLNY